MKVNIIPTLSKAAIRRALAGEFDLSKTKNKVYAFVRAYERKYLVRVLKNGKVVFRADAPPVSVIINKPPEEKEDIKEVLEYIKEVYKNATFTPCYNV